MGPSWPLYRTAGMHDTDRPGGWVPGGAREGRVRVGVGAVRVGTGNG